MGGVGGVVCLVSGVVLGAWCRLVCAAASGFEAAQPLLLLSSRPLE